MFINSVQEFYSEGFQTVNQNDLLKSCLHMLKKEKPSAVVVVDGKGNYKGIVSSSMIDKSQIDETKTRVKRVMQPAPKLQITDSLVKAARLMIQTNFSKIPVFERDQIKGIITDEQTIHGAVMQNWGENEISTIQTKNPMSLKPSDNVGKVRAMFRKHKISHMPIIDDKKLVGIISQQDLLDFSTKPRFRQTRGDRKGEKEEMTNVPVESVMVSPVITVPPTTTLKDAEKKMHDNNIGSLIIKEGEKLLGIVTRTDFLEPIAEMEIEEKRIWIQFSENDVDVDEINKSKMIDRFNRFIKNYQKFLVHGNMKVLMNKIGPGKKGDQHVEIKIHFWTKVGKFDCKVQGYGVFDMFQEALKKTDRLVKEKIGRLRDY